VDVPSARRGRSVLFLLRHAARAGLLVHATTADAWLVTWLVVALPRACWLLGRPPTYLLPEESGDKKKKEAALRLMMMMMMMIDK